MPRCLSVSLCLYLCVSLWAPLSLSDNSVSPPPKQRAATVLRYFEDATYEEIADVLECEAATARSLVSRGLKALRKSLEGHDDGPF